MVSTVKVILDAAIGIEPMHKGFAGRSEYMLLSIMQYHTRVNKGLLICESYSVVFGITKW